MFMVTLQYVTIPIFNMSSYTFIILLKLLLLKFPTFFKPRRDVHIYW